MPPLTTTGCKKALQDEMRKLVGGNVDDTEVAANFEAFGEGLRKILTEQAGTVSNSTADATFWPWVTAVNTWLGQLHTWESGINAAVDAWVPATPSEVLLRNALRGVPRPPAAPAAAPAQLEGKIV